MKNLILIALISLIVFSCEETIVLDLDQTEPVLVIEGLVTNNASYNYVKLSQTGPFSSTGIDLVSGASVLVSDQNNQQFTFAETEPGLYLPDTPLEGVVGTTYTLTVEYQGTTYTASEQMPSVNPIDSMSYLRIDDVDEEFAEEEQFYELYLFLTEPQDEENYYLFKFYRNEEVLDFDGTSVYIFDDVIIGESIEGLATPEYYAKGDLATVEMFGVTRRAYRYFIDLSNNLNNDGGIFSGIPANAGTNIEGGAVGYFQVSALEVGELTIEE